MWPYKTTPIYQNLKPYEVIRWRLTDLDGVTLGYASRLHHDGANHWWAWDAEDGFRQQVHSRGAAFAVLIEEGQRKCPASK